MFGGHMHRKELVELIESKLDTHQSALGSEAISFITFIRNELLDLKEDTLQMKLDSCNKERALFKLADAFYEHLRWQMGCEFGGIGLGDKRPFGNSSVEIDILRISEVLTYDEYSNLDEDDQDTAEQYARDLYGMLPDFLRGQWAKRQGNPK
jgi:hypothetical protein